MHILMVAVLGILGILFTGSAVPARSWTPSIVVGTSSPHERDVAPGRPCAPVLASSAGLPMGQAARIGRDDDRGTGRSQWALAASMLMARAGGLSLGYPALSAPAALRASSLPPSNRGPPGARVAA